MTPYKKTVTKPCKVCDGTGDERNKYGARLNCRGCNGTGKQTDTTVIEELPEEYTHA